jgi:hypothetical protein
MSIGQWQDKVSPCWLWDGWRNKDGYGLIQRNGKQVFVHRLMYEIFVGQLYDGLCVIHSCESHPASTLHI